MPLFGAMDNECGLIAPLQGCGEGQTMGCAAPAAGQLHPERGVTKCTQTTMSYVRDRSALVMDALCAARDKDSKGRGEGWGLGAGR